MPDTQTKKAFVLSVWDTFLGISLQLGGLLSQAAAPQCPPELVWGCKARGGLTSRTAPKGAFSRHPPRPSRRCFRSQSAPPSSKFLSEGLPPVVAQ